MVSAILNIVGLAAAFAALYIILVQVRPTSRTTRHSKTATGSMFLRHKSPDPVVIRLICVAP